VSFWNLVETFVQGGRGAAQAVSGSAAPFSHNLNLAVLNRDLYADREGWLVDASRGGSSGFEGCSSSSCPASRKMIAAPRVSSRSPGRTIVKALPRIRKLLTAHPGAFVARITATSDVAIVLQA